MERTTMEGSEFNPKDKRSLQERFDMYCRWVIYHGTHNTVDKQTTYLKRQWSGSDIEPDKLAEEDERIITDAVEIMVREHKVVFHDKELADLVLSLQARKREILLLSEVLDYTLKEIASELNLAYETVKSTKSKALRELREEMVNHYGEKD